MNLIDRLFRGPAIKGSESKPKHESQLVFSAEARCICGAGLAYVRGSDPFKGYWDCSAILLGTADIQVKHTDKLPFVFYEIKSEKQTSAGGMTTRPDGER